MKNNVFAKEFKFKELGELHQVLFTLIPNAEGNLVINGSTKVNGMILHASLKDKHMIGEAKYRTPEQVFQELDWPESKLFWKNIILTAARPENQPGLKLV